MNENDYPSIICQYCSCTNHGDSPCSMVTPSGYASCEGRECDTAYEQYVEDTQDDTPLEDLF